MSRRAKLHSRRCEAPLRNRWEQPVAWHAVTGDGSRMEFNGVRQTSRQQSVLGRERLGWCVISGVLAATMMSATLCAQNAPPVTVVKAPRSSASSAADSAEIFALVTAAKHPSMTYGRLSDISTDLHALYASNGWQPHWIKTTTPADEIKYSPSLSATELVTSISLASQRGLNANDYDAGKLPALMLQLSTPQSRAEYDVAFSANALRLVRSLHEGRLRPSDAHAELRIPREPYDAALVVAHLAADSGHMEHLLDNEEPPFIHYSLLKKSLAKYRALRTDSTLTKLPPFPKNKIIKPGEVYLGLGPLRVLLTGLGDLPLANYAPNRDTTVLLGDVLEGLRHFQKRTGLESDGNIGPMTIAALRKPFDSRIRTIELSLERWRWLPRNYGAPPILVNLPAFRLYAYSGNSDDERDVLAMDVVIGGSFDKKTPIFSDTLRTIVFSPYWDVPISIATAEIVPKARKDIEYLNRNDYEIVRGEADASPVLPNESKSLDLVLKGIARIRQKPGPKNSLGGVKFLFPNSHNIYFHDTPSRSTFNKARRDASHGCIRLSEPVQLAALLLGDQEKWTRAAIDSSMVLRAPRRVGVKKPRPVFILYATAMATQDGKTYFYPDIYGYDLELVTKLEKSYPYAH